MKLSHDFVQMFVNYNAKRIFKMKVFEPILNKVLKWTRSRQNLSGDCQQSHCDQRCGTLNTQLTQDPKLHTSNWIVGQVTNKVISL